jgi:hypothetical protein
MTMSRMRAATWIGLPVAALLIGGAGFALSGTGHTPVRLDSATRVSSSSPASASTSAPVPVPSGPVRAPVPGPATPTSAPVPSPSGAVGAPVPSPTR